MALEVTENTVGSSCEFCKICGNDNAGVLAVALHRQDLDIGVHAGLCLRTLRFVAVGASSTCLQRCLGTCLLYTSPSPRDS